MKRVTMWEKLKLQIDNLELMAQQHNEGADVSNSVYWQVEYLNELLSSVESHLGADTIRNAYKEL